MTAPIQSTLFNGLIGADLLQQSAKTLFQQLGSYLQPSELHTIEHTLSYGAKAHDGQMRQSGEPYFTHPIAVCLILAEQHFDLPVLQAALLHDVLEDTSVEYGQMVAEFGEEVTRLVDGVSKLDRLKHQAPQEVEADSFKKMFVATTDDPRVIIIKLADRLHNMQTLGSLRPDKRVRKAKETLEVYASIAGRLGLFYFRLQLEDLAFSHLYPWRYRVLQKHYKLRFEQNDVIAKVRKELAPLLQALGIKASINKRQRHLWGLYQRMKRKSSFNDAVRTIPLRIVAEKEDDCYRILGKVHSLYRPIVGKFEDFIAAPKSNGYRSIHTSVLMPSHEVLNIQIRTRDMHTLAESGIISVWHQHLKQKHLRHERHSIQTHQSMRDWLSRLRDVQSITHNPLEFYEAVKKELTQGDIHVYTPKGKVIDLPLGATPIDFAYAVDHGLGNHCVAAKVNGHDFPLFKALEPAQTVEIITDENASPHSNWLELVVTAKAKAGIKHYLHNLAEQQAQAIGAKYLDMALQRLGQVGLEQLDLALLSDYLRKHKIDKPTLLRKLSQGELQPSLVASALLGQQLQTTEHAQTLMIHSALDTAIQLAQCCHPLPYEKIVGELMPAVGVRIHRYQCPYIAQANQLDWIRVQWADKTQGVFAAAIELDVRERRRILAIITAIIADEEANINDFSVKTHLAYQDLRTLLFVLTVKNRAHLARIIRRLRTSNEVVDIRRI